MLQAVIAFSPTVMERQGQRYARILDRMLNENDTELNRCVKYILNKCLVPSELMTEDLNCCGAHNRKYIV